ncbi:MAG TPA: GNAT family N-acetyltransferase [candidate division Zixibacteria bacterium]|nr:GNAT family N-acetyltransferase [candidate division Zixibacteria bacterium]
MRILAYQDLEDKDALLPLMDQAFGWPFHPEEFDRTIRIDPRLRESCVGLCAFDAGRVAGYVGIMDLATRTLEGKMEKAGGIYGVATLPGYTRQGICRTLIDRAHEYLIEKHYRFSFLTTSPTIVAYDLYRKLGYFDVASFPGAYKVVVKKKNMEKTQGGIGLDFGGMLEIYDRYVKDKTGLVVRDEAYMKMLAKTLEISARECITTDRGYVIFKKEKKHVRIRELAACDEKEMHRLVGLIEKIAQNLIYARTVLDRNLQRVYRSHGCSVLQAGHGVIMVKELTDTPFSEAYGDRFYMSSLDNF